jgi:hypothetical protein
MDILNRLNRGWKGFLGARGWITEAGELEGNREERRPPRKAAATWTLADRKIGHYKG